MCGVCNIFNTTTEYPTNFSSTAIFINITSQPFSSTTENSFNTSFISDSPNSTVTFQVCNNIIRCLNSGIFNPSNCTCYCKIGFYGKDCSQYDCNFITSLLDPLECQTLECSEFATPICPKKCLCSNYSTNLVSSRSSTREQHLNTSTQSFYSNSVGINISTTAVLFNITTSSNSQNLTICTNTIQCMNLGIFNPLDCKCTCHFGFFGDNCSQYDCNTFKNYADPVECQFIECSISGVNGLCPRKCLCRI
jgi:hypothetical protein